jgi:hypothetical protein
MIAIQDMGVNHLSRTMHNQSSAKTDHLQVQADNFQGDFLPPKGVKMAIRGVF